MKTDKLFYRIFLSQPDLISELLPDIPADCKFEYSAPVVKETEVRLDGLLTPSSDDLSLPLVFLEAQMQSDVNFLRQMLDLKEVNFSETRFYQDVLQKGLEQGLEQGLQRGEADLVVWQLQRRCGAISVDCLRQATPTTTASSIATHCPIRTAW
jgi:predicted transposase YdaD